MKLAQLIPDPNSQPYKLLQPLEPFSNDPNITIVGREIPASAISDLSYLTDIYQIVLWAIIILAAVMLVIGGVQYAAVGISPSQKNDAKTRMTNALIGLALALLSWLILFTINPNLVSLRVETTLIASVSIPCQRAERTAQNTAPDPGRAGLLAQTFQAAGQPASTPSCSISNPCDCEYDTDGFRINWGGNVGGNDHDVVVSTLDAFDILTGPENGGLPHCDDVNGKRPCGQFKGVKNFAMQSLIDDKQNCDALKTGGDCRWIATDATGPGHAKGGAHDRSTAFDLAANPDLNNWLTGQTQSPSEQEVLAWGSSPGQPVNKDNPDLVFVGYRRPTFWNQDGNRQLDPVIMDRNTGHVWVYERGVQRQVQDENGTRTVRRGEHWHREAENHCGDPRYRQYCNN